MAISVASVPALLRTLYPQKVLREMLYTESRFLARVKKSTDFTGNNKSITVKYAGCNGRSHTFATAQANRTGPLATAFTITRSKDYMSQALEYEFIKACKSDKGAFVDGVTDVSKSIMNVLTKSLARSVMGDGLAKIGQITAGSDVTTATITLTNPADAIYFEKGLKVVASAAGATARGSAGTVLSVDRNLGTVTLTAHWDDATGAVAGDFIIVEGDITLGMPGVAAWVPSSAPSSALFYGVDRTADSRLSGIIFDGTGKMLNEAIKKGVARQLRENVIPTDIFVSPTTFCNLALELEDKVIYQDVKAVDVEMGINSIKLMTPAGAVSVISDLYVPNDKVYSLRMADWELHGLGEMPEFHDGGDLDRIPTEAAYEIRAGWMGALACELPGAQMVINIDAQV